MKKIIHRFLALVLTLAMVLPLAGPMIPESVAASATNVATSTVSWDFSDASQLTDFTLYQSATSSLSISDGVLKPSGTDGEMKAIVNKKFDAVKSVSVDMIPGENGINAAIYLGASNVGNNVDQINALAFIVESTNKDANRIDVLTGSFPWVEHDRYISNAEHGNALFTNGEKKPVNLRLDLDDDNVTVTLSLVEDPSTYTQTVYYCDTAGLSSQIGIRDFFNDVAFDNLTITYEDTLEADLHTGLSFNGSNLPLVKTDSAISQIPSTIEMWVKMNPRPNNSTEKYRQPLISCVNPAGSSSTTAGDFELLTGADGTFWWYETTDKTIKDTSDAANFQWNKLCGTNYWNSQWAHVALTRQEGKIVLYINGEQVGIWENDLVGQDATPTNPITFGYSPVQSGITKNNLDGSIGDVRLWSTVRTQDEIRKNMNRSLAGTEEGLMHYWKLDEGSGSVFQDSVKNGINGTINTQTAALNKEPGLIFEGVNERIVEFSEPVSQIPQTVELWMYIDEDAESVRQSLIGAYSAKTQAPSAVGDWNLDINFDVGTKLRWVDHTSLGTSGQKTCDIEITKGQWTHVAVTRSSDMISFYINGELINTASYNVFEDTTESVTKPVLGYSIFDTNAVKTNYLDGAIKDVRLWSDTRTAEEIKGNMNKSLTGTEEGLMNYWRLDEGSGNVIKDSASAGNNGTIAGSSVSWCNESSLEIMGSNQPVVIADSAVAEIPKTVELWVRIDEDSATVRHSLISAYSATTQAPSAVGDWNFDINCDGGTKLRWVDHTSLGTSGQKTCAVDIPMGQWAHLAVTRSANGISFYVNGEFVKKVSYSIYEDSTASVTKPVLGYSIFDTHTGNTNYLDGNLKDVRLWNVTRTAEEIKADMNKTLTGTEAGLMNYWKLDETEGTVLADSTAAGNDFEIASVTWTKAEIVEDEPVTVTNVGLNNPHGRKLRTLNNVNAGIKSVEAWVKVPTNIGDNRRLTVISAYPNVNFHMDIYTYGRPRLWFQNAAGSGAHFVVPNVDLRTNQWTHIAFVLDETAGELYCYINGELVHTFTSVGNALTVKKLYVGRDDRTGWQYPFMGQVADIRVWDKTLTAQEVKYSMNTTDIGVQEGLLLNLPLDEGDNADVYKDLSGNENNVMVMPDNLTWIDVEKKPSDYSIAIIPDQQYLTASYVDKLNGIYQWIADNAESENMQMVINLGDITDNNSATHWQRALDAYNIIKDEVPYIFAPGNHDYNWDYYRDATNLNKYFPLSMLQESENYGGAYAEDDSQNTWQQFEVMGNKYLILALEFCPRDAVLEWANEVVASHPEHQVIVVTHGYMDYDGTWLEGNDGFGADSYTYIASETEPPNDAAMMWDKFVRKHENIIMVLSGHIFASDDVVVKTDIGDHGNEVKQFLIDAQRLDSKAGGLGLVAMMNFSNDGQDVEFTYYCPYMGKYMNYENQFTFNLPKQKDPFAQVGEEVYTTVAEALANANGRVVTILADTDEAITISADVTIDLAGCNLSNVTVAEGATLTLIDSATDNYTGEYGGATVAGSVNTFAEVDGKSYLVVGENGVYSAHRYDVAITHISLDPSNDALGYKAKLYGDAIVQSHVQSFGFNLWVDGGQVKTYTKSGADQLTLRLKNILKNHGGEMNINATAFVSFGERTKTGAQQTTTMKETLQAVNAAWNSYTQTQRDAVKALCDLYIDTVSGWELTNIYPTEETDSAA